MFSQSFIIHNVSHALAVAKVAEQLDKSAKLYSSPGACGSLGPEAFAEMIQVAQKSRPMTSLLGVLDCGTEAGNVISAMRRGITDIHFKLELMVKLKLENIASKNGVRIHCIPRDILDLYDFSAIEILIKSHFLDEKRYE